MLAIWRRELHSYFRTPVGYVFMGFFLFISGLMFMFTNLASASSNLTSLLSQFTTILMFLVPILTMRLFSEERRNKTDQLLLTSPLSLTAIVLGKFLAAVTVFFLTLAGTFLYVVIIGLYGRIYWGETLVAYLGFFLMGSGYIAMGVLVSAMTENQVSAAAATFGLNFLVWIMDSVIYMVPVPLLSTVLEWLSLYRRYSMFTISQLGASGVLYFVSLCTVLLFLAVRVIDKRRWSEG